ncbi:hypothetical protein F5146DRAFT_1181532 [Armillaria mellea]|nr:hypothetical protein F5146DRAFT_1181532 [Armillaria mellea]
MKAHPMGVWKLRQSTSTPSSNVPVEAHILSHWRQPDSVALPFLCIADEKNIIPLIRSTVYQRYTWGISEPVVGMILSETGCIARVVMGWVDEPSDSDLALLRGIHSPWGDSASDLSSTSDITEMSTFSKQSTSTSRSSLNPSVDAKRRRSSHESLIVSSSSTSSKATSGIAEVTDGDPSSIESFLYDRNAFSATRLPLIKVEPTRLEAFMEAEEAPTLSYKNNDSGICNAQNEEVTAMVRIYDELTEYQKPSWDNPPAVDITIQGILDLSQHQLADMDMNTPCSIPLSRKSSLPHFHCSYASLWEGVVKGVAYKPNEAEARHFWDLLFYISFVVSGEVVSQRLLSERQLSLPRNAALGLASGDAESLTALEQQARAVSFLCIQAQVAALSKHEPTDPVFHQAMRAEVDASKYAKQTSILTSSANAAEVINKRAQQEPDNTKCESLLAFPLFFLNSILRCNRPEPLVRDWDNPKLPSQDDQPDEPPEAQEKSVETDRQQKNLFFINASETQTFELTEAELVNIGEEKLLGKHLLAVLIGEYNKPDEEDGKTMNKCKVHLVSAVMHVKCLGISRYPVFGLATNGTVDAFLCCWYSRRLGRVFIMDQNIRHFDISSPIQAYHFMTFLLRLRRWSDEQLKKHQVRILEDADNFMADHSWTRKAQKKAAKKILVDTVENNFRSFHSHTSKRPTAR